MSILSYVLLVLILLLVLAAVIMLGKYRYNFSFFYQDRFVFNAQFARPPFFQVEISFPEKETAALSLNLLGFSFQSRWLEALIFGKKEKPKPEIKQKKKTGTSKVELAKLALDESLRSHFIALAKELLRTIRPRYFSLQGKYGFEEPHLTGWVVALDHLARQFCGQVSINLEPNWEEPGLDLKASAGGSFTGIAVIYCLLRYLISRKTILLWRRMKKIKNKPGFAT